jgi:hypothetical protein
VVPQSAEIPLERVKYIEAHATGTAIGDLMVRTGHMPYRVRKIQIDSTRFASLYIEVHAAPPSRTSW